jgi:hypothetical protein
MTSNLDRVEEELSFGILDKAGGQAGAKDQRRF